MRVDSGPAAGRRATDDPPPLRSWSELAAEPGCAESLRAVARVNPTALSGAELVDAIVASEKAMSLLAARQMGLLTEFARPGRAGDVSEIVAELMDKGGQGRGPDGQIDLDTVETLVHERAASLAAAEVAAALQISPITAGSRVRKAQDLCDGLPATVDALASGRIDRGRAWLIAERTAPLTPSLREAVQERILPIAEDRSAGNLRSLLDRAVIAADPRAAENRERKAKHDRELVLRSLPDGMASVRANAPADAAMSIFTLADLLADRTGTDDDRPVAARRVDAWHDIADQLLTHGYVDLTDLLDHPDPTTETAATQRRSDNPDEFATGCDGDPATTPEASPPADPLPDHAPGSADSPEPDSGYHDCDRDSSDDDSVEDHSPEPDIGERVCSDDGRGEDGRGEDGCSERDTGERDCSESADIATATPASAATTTVGNPDDCVPNGATGDTADFTELNSGQSVPRSATSTDMGASPASAAGRSGAGQPGAVATGPAHQQLTPDPTARSTDGATPPAAARLSCVTCGGHQPGTPPASTVGNRDERRASRRASRQGRRPHLTVTLSASTLAGLDRLPGHLEGYGAITADTALMIAKSAASITTVLLDPASGSITGTGARTYRPPQATRDITTTLATTCRFPSCRQPAWRCDLDHRDPFDHQHPDSGGATEPANLDPLCHTHHWLKHHSAWSSTRGPDHTQIWTSPTGHRYTDPPRTLTLPGELLDPTDTDTSAAPDAYPAAEAYAAPEVYSAADGRHPQPDPSPSDLDDEGLRPDWRDAEFGGPFPDTLELKVLVTTVRNRVQQVRDIISAPRPTRTAEDTNDHDGPRDSDADQWEATDPPTQARRVDPDEPPF